VRPGGHDPDRRLFPCPGLHIGGGKVRTVGGGHPVAGFRDTAASLGLETLHDEDITAAVAPSIDLEAGLFRVFGHGVDRVDEELAAKRPAASWAQASFSARSSATAVVTA
jgi:hypothetical protein